MPEGRASKIEAIFGIAYTDIEAYLQRANNVTRTLLGMMVTDAYDDDVREDAFSILYQNLPPILKTVRAYENLFTVSTFSEEFALINQRIEEAMEGDIPQLDPPSDEGA